MTTAFTVLAFSGPAFFAAVFFAAVFFAGAFFADVVFLGAAALTPTLVDAAFLATVAFFAEDFVTAGLAGLAFRGEAFLTAGFLVAAAWGLRTGAFLTADDLRATGASVGGFGGSSVPAGVADPADGLTAESTAAGSVASLGSKAISLWVRPKSIIDKSPIWCK